MTHWQSKPALRRLVAAAAVVVLAATAAALAARFNWFLDLFSHFRWQYVLAAAVTIPLAWQCGQRWLAVACVAALLVHLQALCLQRFAPGPPIMRTEPSLPLRVVSFNVHYSSAAYAPLIRFLDRASPNVVCLFETTPDWRQQLAPLTARFPFSLFTGDGPRTGLACMSDRVPLRVVPPPSDANDAPWIQLDLDLGGTAVSVFGVHLSCPVAPAAAAARNRQSVDLARELRAISGPVVAVGDFNLTPFTPHNGDFVMGSGLRDCSRGRPLAPTWPTWFAPLWIQIDRCFVSNGVGVARYEVGQHIGSDHYPLVMDFLIPKRDIPRLPGANRTLAQTAGSIERPRVRGIKD
jgi:endonuclease/exonuclease/phosphatase (EEP) superfamily protein YafD